MHRRNPVNWLMNCRCVDNMAKMVSFWGNLANSREKICQFKKKQYLCIAFTEIR